MSSSGKGLKKVCPYKYSVSKRMTQDRSMLTALLKGVLPRRYASNISRKCRFSRDG
jgi:hypothetical protein